MSTLHQSRGRADADTGKGELRKPQDYSDQPDRTETQERDDTADRPSPHAGHEASAPQVGESRREYGHSSADRNTMRHARDWHGFEGGIQRDATPDAPLDPDKRPDKAGKRGGRSEPRSSR